MKRIIFLTLIVLFPSTTLAEPEAWVTSENLNRRTCPSTECSIVGKLYFRERVTIYENRQEWVRVSKYYDANCKNGYSEYVDSGNAKCTPKNGIIDGKFAVWVNISFLSSKRPSDPTLGATGDYSLVKGSDDYSKYKLVFASSARKLIANGKCTENDFIQNGGWIKSSNYKNQPIYFTYCGGMRINNKLYLNAENGQITK